MNLLALVLAAACFTEPISCMLTKRSPRQKYYVARMLAIHKGEKMQAERKGEVMQSSASVEMAMLSGLKFDSALAAEFDSKDSEKNQDLRLFVKLCLAEPFSSPILQRAYSEKFDELLAKVSQAEANKVLGLLIQGVSADKPYLFQRVKKILGQDRWVKDQEGKGGVELAMLGSWVEHYLNDRGIYGGKSIWNSHLAFYTHGLHDFILYLCQGGINLDGLSQLADRSSTKPVLASLYKTLTSPSIVWKLALGLPVDQEAIIKAAIDYSAKNDMAALSIVLPAIRDYSKYLTSLVKLEEFRNAVWQLLLLPSPPLWLTMAILDVQKTKWPKDHHVSELMAQVGFKSGRSDKDPRKPFINPEHE